ncbi:MAG: FAD-binding oxidoreductase, partial [Gammaproteobacteria bacterium]|nr:FAD-binding oxidoreductase [Gammaproteobacteria bacterium]
MQDLIANLRELLEPSAVLTGEQLGGNYSVDYTAENPHAPLALLRPKTTEEVAEIMRACHAAAQPVVIQGGLTGLTGGATPRPGEIALSLERMSGITEIDADGTLGTITRCALQLYPQLASRATALCALETFDDAVALLGASRRHMTNSL